MRRWNECSSHDGEVTTILGSSLASESDLLYRHKRKGADLSDPPSYSPAWPEDRPLQIQGLHPCIPWEQNTLSLLPMENSTVRGTQPHTSGRPVLSSVPVGAARVLKTSQGVPHLSGGYRSTRKW